MFWQKCPMKTVLYPERFALPIRFVLQCLLYEFLKVQQSCNFSDESETINFTNSNAPPWTFFKLYANGTKSRRAPQFF